MATTLHVIERYLELSSGFVHAQVSRSRHRGVVVSRFATEHLEAFPFPTVLQVPALVDRLPGGPRDRSLRWWLGRARDRAGAELVHAHFAYALPYAATTARDRVPLVASLHGHDVTAWPTTAPWAFAPEIVAAPAAVIVPSRWLADVAASLGFAPARTHVIPSGVDTAFFAASPLPDGPPVTAFIGRMVEKKGVDVLCAAWPRVHEAVPGAQLRLVGDGPLADAVDAFAAATPGVSRAAPDPARRAQQVRDAIGAASVVVTPSHASATGDSESLLLVNLEAQASGRAVVTTRHGGIPEFVDEGKSALVVPEGDPVALADALIEVLRDRALATRLGAHGPSVAARYDVRAMAAQIDDLYDTLLT